MYVLAGDGAADGGGVDADFFGHVLDHHRLERIEAVGEKFGLAAHDGLADLEDGLFALLDVLHQLNGGGVAFADIIANFLGGALIAVQHAPVLGVQAELRHVLVIHLDDVIVAVLDEGNVRLDHPRARSGITQPGPRIEVADHVDGNLDVLGGPSQQARHLLVLAGFEQAHVAGDDLPGDAALAVDTFDLQQHALA